MLLVIADGRDPGARLLVERWRPHGVRLIEPRDLCAPGWRFAPGDPERDTLAVGGEVIAARDLRGVVVRIPCVRTGDLPQIALEDRAYVAAELTAFLTAWLDALSCPVVNRPSGSSLLGPPLSHERWLAVAVRAGVPVATAAYRAPNPTVVLADRIATIVGARWLGLDAADAAIGELAVRVARAAGVDVMVARFAGGALASADLIVDITPDVADALLAHIAARAEAYS